MIARQSIGKPSQNGHGATEKGLQLHLEDGMER